MIHIVNTYIEKVTNMCPVLVKVLMTRPDIEGLQGNARLSFDVQRDDETNRVTDWFIGAE